MKRQVAVLCSLAGAFIVAVTHESQGRSRKSAHQHLSRSARETERLDSVSAEGERARSHGLGLIYEKLNRPEEVISWERQEDKKPNALGVSESGVQRVDEHVDVRFRGDQRRAEADHVSVQTALADQHSPFLRLFENTHDGFR